jgi:hypothetical protein
VPSGSKTRRVFKVTLGGVPQLAAVRVTLAVAENPPESVATSWIWYAPGTSATNDGVGEAGLAKVALLRSGRALTDQK